VAKVVVARCLATYKITMKRKFTHYVINAVLISMTSLFIFGFVNLVYHLIFNNPTITYGF